MDACTTDCLDAACGDGFVYENGGEECDDGNNDDDDGCSSDCKNEQPECSGNAVEITTDPDLDMVVCSDPNVCEQDYASICPAGWNLCTHAQYVQRNDNWNYQLPGNQVLLAAIRCRMSGGAGHYSRAFGWLSDDYQDNCQYGSSRPQCQTGYGCNDKGSWALCCRPTPSCGDGVVNSAEEECDDGNQSNDDDCFNNCMDRENNALYCD